MPITLNAVAYGTVIVGAIALFAVGTPASRSTALEAARSAETTTTPAYSAALEKQIAAATPAPKASAAAAPTPPAPPPPAPQHPAPQPPAPTASAPTTTQAAGITLHSITVEFPTTETTFPPGPGADLLANNCQSCHSPGMILTQPLLTKAEWTGEVNKMVHTYNAPIPEEEIPSIVAYLTSLKVGP